LVACESDVPPTAVTRGIPDDGVLVGAAGLDEEDVAVRADRRDHVEVESGLELPVGVVARIVALLAVVRGVRAGHGGNAGPDQRHAADRADATDGLDGEASDGA
jgi:hypothetical protein